VDHSRSIGNSSRRLVHCTESIESMLNERASIALCLNVAPQMGLPKARMNLNGEVPMAAPGGEMKIMVNRRLQLGVYMLCGISLFLFCHRMTAQLQQTGRVQTPELVIIDTDIGDDVDDAFAISLALASNELKIVGITSAWGDTQLRSQMLDRFLCEAGRSDIPVATGIPTVSKIDFSQSFWAKQGPRKQHLDAVTFLLDQIKKNPGQITLIAIAPLTNIASAIDRDPQTFTKLKRIVMMGGSIRKGYDGQASTGPDPEYNIQADIPAAKKVFSSGVPIYLMPLDSTEIPLDEVRRAQLFTDSTPLTDALTLLYQQWTRSYHWVTPTLFDAMPVAYIIQPELCPTTPLHIDIDGKGYTRETPGRSNVEACLQSDNQKFLQFYMNRMLDQRLSGNEFCRVSPRSK
jgi:purine nucleosidase